MVSITQPVTKHEVTSIICDRCKTKIDKNSPAFGSITRIDHRCGYGSVWDDGMHISADLCERCLKDLIGRFCHTNKKASSPLLTADSSCEASIGVPQPIDGRDGFFNSEEGVTKDSGNYRAQTQPPTRTKYPRNTIKKLSGDEALQKAKEASESTIRMHKAMAKGRWKPTDED